MLWVPATCPPTKCHKPDTKGMQKWLTRTGADRAPLSKNGANTAERAPKCGLRNMSYLEPLLSCHGNRKHLKLCFIQPPKGKKGYREDSLTLVANTLARMQSFSWAAGLHLLQLNSEKWDLKKEKNIYLNDGVHIVLKYNRIPGHI